MLLSIASLSAKKQDSLYLSLHKKAQANLKNLPSYAKKDYTLLLKMHPDRVMAFLLAYEENGRLAVTDPMVVQSHYQSVLELMQEQGIKQADEFFLSYVAKITVSDEAISNYRYLFENDHYYDEDYEFSGLNLKKIRSEIKDPIELYRKMCLISTELLRYKQTSGRDQSPLDIAVKSQYGRCEESQILFAALCRTVGIPTRPASTPWWAHQDDNHAWVEVFLNGKWHYSGDADGGYWPNQTWFTSLVNKMVIITADGTLPAPDDEVLSQDQYGAVINSIKYYAGENTRTLKLKVIDKDGKAVAKANLGIDVYNYYSLRPQTFTQTDDKGEKTITVGQGAFFIMAFKDSLSTLQYVPSNQEKELSYTFTLKQSNLPEIKAFMHYPNYKPEFKDAPQSWKDDVKLANDKWQKRNDDISQLAKIISPVDDSLFVKVLQKFRFNYSPFMELYRSTKNYNFEGVACSDEGCDYFKFMSLPHGWFSALLDNDEKDLWQADTDLIERMYGWYYVDNNELPREEELNLFEPTVFYENLPWMSHYLAKFYITEGLYPKQMILKKTFKPTPQQVIKHFQKKHKINADKSVIGLIPLETALAQKNLTAYQYKILACYYLRANQIPANYTRIPYVISIYADGAWKYYDIVKNRYYETTSGDKPETDKVQFSFSDEAGQPIALKPEQVHICFLKDGQFFPTNEQPDYVGNGVFETMVPQKGMFYAQIGYRNSDSLTVYYLKPLSEKGKPLSKVEMTLEHYHRKWLPAEEFLKPVTAELEKRQLNYAVLGNHSQENSIRMANKLKSLQKEFLLLGYQESVVSDYAYAVLPLYLDLIREVPSLQNRTLTLVRDEKSGDWNMYEGLWDALP
jgi:hypothetical protein